MKTVAIVSSFNLEHSNVLKIAYKSPSFKWDCKMVTLTFHRHYLSGVIDFFLMKIIFKCIDAFRRNINLIT